MPPISDSRFTIHDSAPAGARMTHPDEVDLLMRGSVFEAGGCAPASSERHSGVVQAANPVAQLRMPRGCAPLADGLPIADCRLPIGGQPVDLTIGEWRTGSTGKSRTSPAKRSFWLEECCCGHRRGFHREGGLMCTVRGCACAGFITWAEADASRLEEWLTDDSAPRRLMWPFGEFEAQRSGEGTFPPATKVSPEITGPNRAAAIFEALCRRFSWRGRRLSTGRDGRGAPAASALTRTEHENWGAE